MYSHFLKLKIQILKRTAKVDLWLIGCFIYISEAFR